MPVYLIHFNSPVSKYSTSQHYIGCSGDVEKRFLQHQMGQNSARIIEVAIERGIGFQLVRTWEGTSEERDWELERRLKKQKNPWRLCPLCKNTERKAAPKAKRKKNMQYHSKATEAQKQAAKARREKFRALVAKIAGMTESERAKFAAKIGTVMNCEGHALSADNTMLLIHQLETVSIVGGFKQWKKHGRNVRKGEKGICIWVPIKPKDENGEALQDADKPGFFMGTVFDVSQTEITISKKEKNTGVMLQDDDGNVHDVSNALLESAQN